MNLAELKEIQNKIKAKYNQEYGILSQINADTLAKETELKENEKKLEDVNTQILILKEASTEGRENSKELLKDISTKALKYIIGDYVSLDIQFSEKGNSTVADFLVRSEYAEDYVVEADPAEEEGGGIADIVAFATQIAMLQLTGKKNLAPLFLDEPSKYVSKAHSENVASFLFEISSYLDRQVIMVTHDEFLANTADKAYHFKIEEGSTIATAL